MNDGVRRRGRSSHGVLRPWPSLFGRCTLLSSDHARAADVANALSEACRYSHPAQAPILWSDLIPLLVQQFAREESEGYHGLIRQATPSLAHEVERLHADHQVVLEELRRLLSFTRQGTRETFLAAVNHFTARLEAHEQREARLMRDFLLLGAGEA